uniref:Thiosulfate/3-mercaptopyruvate sulfurtransferase n=1 Tax=Candidatus Kentrum sp. TUN TaxID=2126343 RepID=A0A451A1S2_9GAMM|nr:MAG: thiosulfate/3-mercaptopyruvate sulfurtransferase [Candidatus Kentron sp. TUN]VFK59981.1 MAG: thiosulfate/3-mercaptopyruvate sulfurtransferase [Candidatus Kentron sp. TUN]VFK69241.1 MAG: thiosulfate/3-mercaptopyruvate sulfurtransferase [Candidatus Kentron sp. TUN]
MNKKILYPPNEVETLISRNAVVLIDIRGSDAYEKGHIPGAVNVENVFSYLSTSTPEGLAELHRNFAKLFSNAGVSNDKTVIVYEDSLNTLYGGSCRGYWLFEYLGHLDAGILDGGLIGWSKAGLPLECGGVTPKPTNFSVNPRNNLMATKDDVLDVLSDPSVVLLDVRDEVEWIGQSSSPYGIDFAPRKGRIPSAKWIEWYQFMDSSLAVPAFKSKERIQELCAEQDIYPDSDIIIYCFKGARASNTYVALKEAGFKNLRNYFASWDEWSRIPELPIDESSLEWSDNA